MKNGHFVLSVASFLIFAADPAGAEKATKLEVAMLAAARTHDGEAIHRLIEESFKQRGALNEIAAKGMLDGLARGGEASALALLLEHLRQTNYGKDWQPDEALLGELVSRGRRELLDIMLASWLEPSRLEAHGADGDPEMRAWVMRRVGQERERRASVDALVEASGRGDLATMRRLLDEGTQVNGVTSKESRHTPLTLAAAKSQLEAVLLLLERGAAVDEPKHPGWNYTPLCLTKSVAVAELLKTYGANVHAKLFGRNVSILTYMARFGGADMVEWMLAQGLDPRMIGDHGRNLLFEAGDAKTAEVLLRAGVDPNAVDEFGRTPLLSAQKGVAEKLIAAGAKLPGQDITAMIDNLASVDSITAVIRAKGGLDAETAQKALIAATHTDQDEVVGLLLTQGAEANRAGYLGSGKDDPILPLMMCAVSGSKNSAKILIAHGADPNAGDRPGVLLQSAIENGESEVARILWEAGGRGVSELAFQILVKNESRISELLESAPAFTERPEFWADVLPSAARTGRLRIVRTALAKGVPIKVPQKEGDVSDGERASIEVDAISAAASEGQPEVLAELIANRGEASNANDLRQPLWMAVWNSHPYKRQRPAADFERCVKQLLDAGAPVTGGNGDLPLVSAAVFTRYPGGNPNVVDMLVEAGADPNPQVGVGEGSYQPLSAAIERACAQQGCSTPFARTIAAVEKHANVVIKR